MTNEIIISGLNFPEDDGQEFWGRRDVNKQTTMRERFDEKFKYIFEEHQVGTFYLDLTKYKTSIPDFIEQELKQEREECIKIAESMRTDWDNEMVNTIDWKDANDWTVDNIINTIKNRT